MRIDGSGHVTELFNLLINPTRNNFALRWHRDDVPEDASEEEEHRILNSSHFGVGSFICSSMKTPSMTYISGAVEHASIPCLRLVQCPERKHLITFRITTGLYTMMIVSMLFLALTSQ